MARVDSTSSGSGGLVSRSWYVSPKASHLSVPIWWKGSTSTRLTEPQRSMIRATLWTFSGSSVRSGTSTNRAQISIPLAARRSPKVMVGARERPVTFL